jgi:hypothetical protein
MPRAGDYTDATVLAATDSIAWRTGSGTLEATAAQGQIAFINAQTGASYSLLLTDQQKLVTMSNASANTVTFPLNATVAFPVGTVVTIAQIGAGQTTLVATGGVTLNKPATQSLILAEQYATVTAVKLATDTWLLSGMLQ